MKDNSLLILILSLFLAAGICFCDAEETFASNSEENLSVEVYYETDGNEELLKSFDTQELKNIAAEEGNREYTYSTFNTFPTFLKIEKVTGPTVRRILNDSLRNNTVNSEVDTVDGIADNWVIEFRANDGVREWFTKSKLFNEKRYYYPNAGREQGRRGQPVLQESFEAVGEELPTEVPAVISLTEKAGNDEAATHEDSEDVGRLLFGQTVPNEQNRAEFVKFMTSRGSRIVIHSQSAEAWNPVTDSQDGNTLFLPGESITLNRDVNPSFKDSEVNPRYWIYYTFTRDGTEPEEPTNRSNMYNYNNFAFDDANEKINKPVILEPGEVMTIKVKVCGYGRPDSISKTITLTGKIIDMPELTVKRTSYNTISLNWTKVSGATGYKIYRSETNADHFKLLKTIEGDSALIYKDNTCKSGMRYYYKVRAYTSYLEAESGTQKTIYGGYSDSKWSIASLDQNTIKVPSVTAAKRVSYNTIKINWSKVNYVTGYQVYRSKGNSQNFKLLKTIKGNTILTYKDATCLTGTKYYYRVRAYTPAFNANSESEYTLFSGYSNNRYAVATLTKPAIKFLTAGKKKATVKWGRITGASGYVIYRSTKKSSGYKTVKTITKGGTVSFTNKKLKKGKRYYFKMRAYRTVSGKKVYSSYSAVKSVRVK